MKDSLKKFYRYGILICILRILNRRERKMIWKKKKF